jgi:hypothetical protein
MRSLTSSLVNSLLSLICTSAPIPASRPLRNSLVLAYIIFWRVLAHSGALQPATPEAAREYPPRRCLLPLVLAGARQCWWECGDECWCRGEAVV